MSCRYHLPTAVLDPNQLKTSRPVRFSNLVFFYASGNNIAAGPSPPALLPPGISSSPDAFPPRTAPRLRSGREEKDAKSEPPKPADSQVAAVSAAATVQPPMTSARPVPPPTSAAALTSTTSLPVASCVSRDYSLTVGSLRVTAGRRAALCEERRCIEAGKKILKVPVRYRTYLRESPLYGSFLRD